MQNNTLAGRSTKYVFTIALAGLVMLASSPVTMAITFNDIATNPANGISYQRQPSPIDATLILMKQATLIQPLVFDPINDPDIGIPNLAQFPWETRGWPGVAIFDYDGDGDEDIYVTNGPGASNSLYKNLLVETGGVSFIDVGASSGAGALSQNSSGVCVGDIDNDGDQDLFVSGDGEANRLFENQGNGTFSDISAIAGIGGGVFHSKSCAMGDVNGDGLLDIVVGNAISSDDSIAALLVPFALNEHNQLFMNNGANAFSDASAGSGIMNTEGITLPGAGGVTWAVAMIDYDLDGDIDIITADDQVGTPPPSVGGAFLRGIIHIFQNDGSGAFTDVTVLAGTNKVGAWMGLSFGDVNSDGHMDMFVTNGGDYVASTFRTQFGFPYALGEFASRWFLGTPGGTFSDPGVGGLIATNFGWGTSMFDYDNDGDTDIVYYGDLDLVLLITATNPGTLLENDGTGNFSFNGSAIPKDHSRRTVHGLATGDIDGDGFRDIVAVSAYDKPAPIPLFPYPGLGGPMDPFANFVPVLVPQTPDPTLFSWTGVTFPNGTLSVELNSADNGNNWVEVRVTGSVGLVSGGVVNRDGIGAVVSFTPKHGNTVMQPVLGGSSHLSQDSLAQNFGLGQAEKGVVDVLWPGGVRNRLYHVRASERIVFPEIPCSFDDDSLDKQEHKSCVRQALDELVAAGILGKKERGRFLSSAKKAFKAHRKNNNDD